MTTGVPMGMADLHTHTSLTDGMMDVGALLDRAQSATQLDVLAVTDHDDLTAGLLARELAEQNGYRFQIIVGAEITTLEGHLLGLFLDRPVARFQSLRATIKAIHQQGGLAIVPHPMSWLTFSVGQRALERALACQEPDVYLDGIETANPSVAAILTREKVQRLNKERYALPEVGGSDAHFLVAVGSGYTLFPGKTAEDLRQAILARQTQAAALGLPLSSIGYGELAKQQVRSLLLHPARSLSRPLLKFLGGTPR